ncbi:MAG TPA: single-stranded DNA-binding protein [Chitinophagaceae bacterium]|nr:single-stranded DNA-binding protein [Chitinophagaceae bacterium]
MEITGRLTGNAIVKPVEGSEKPVTNFTVALNRTIRSKGQLANKVTFVECSYWYGENVAPYLVKGILVRVYGHPEVDAYISKKTGYPVGVLRLHAQDVELLSSSKKAVSNEGELVDAEATDIQAQEPVAAGEKDEKDDLPF